MRLRRLAWSPSCCCGTSPSGAGVIDKVESFIEDLGAFETFEFEPDQLLQATALGGAVLAVLATGLVALGAVLFNLISDLVGGIRLTVIEEDPAPPAPVKPRSGGTDGQGLRLPSASLRRLGSERPGLEHEPTGAIAQSVRAHR